ETPMSILSRATLRASCLSAAVSAALCFPVPVLAGTDTAIAIADTADNPADAEIQARTLTTVEVLGVRDALEDERAQIPGGVSVVDGETFYQRPVNNLSDALRYVPGLW